MRLIEWVVVVFWLAFTFLSAVVLMNQFIAMMGETYSKQKSHVAVTWLLLRADIILESERSVMGKPVELWHRKKLPELRPKHHVKVCYTHKVVLLVIANASVISGHQPVMASTYQHVFEERRDQTSGIQGSWEGRNDSWEQQQESKGRSAARAMGQSGAVGIVASPH